LKSKGLGRGAKEYKLLLVHSLDGSIGGGLFLISNETESTASAGVAILDNNLGNRLALEG